jgi:hypothetical protein
VNWARENLGYGGQQGHNPVFQGTPGQFEVSDRLPPWLPLFPQASFLPVTALTLVLWPEARTGPGPHAKHPAYRRAQQRRREVCREVD